MRHLYLSFFKALCWVILAVLGMEAGLSLWNRGAFQEPNFYQLDPVLGVRLIPDTSMRLAYLGVYPERDIHINSAGYRGSEHPPPADTEIAVLGDSLSFGLGVGDEQTYAVQLQEKLNDGTQVINFAVPAYTMHEQNLMVEEVLGTRTPRHLIYPVSVGRFLGASMVPSAGRIRADHGWLIPGSDGNVQVPLPLPSPVMRWSQLVNLFRQRLREPSREALARQIVEWRWRMLMENAKQAGDERARLAKAKWFELTGPEGEPRSWSLLLPHLRDLKAAVQDSTTKVTVLILSPDILLHPSAWSKYELPTQDMGPVSILREDLAASATALGFSVVDATEALKAAGPSASLTRDWHYSATGHRAIAQALHAHLRPRSATP